MENFDLISELMLLLGIAGGVYTFAYALRAWKSKDRDILGNSIEESSEPDDQS